MHAIKAQKQDIIVFSVLEQSVHTKEQNTKHACNKGSETGHDGIFWVTAIGAYQGAAPRDEIGQQTSHWQREEAADGGEQRQKVGQTAPRAGELFP